MMIYQEGIFSPTGLPLQDKLLAIQTRKKATQENFLKTQQSDEENLRLGNFILEQAKEAMHAFIRIEEEQKIQILSVQRASADLNNLQQSIDAVAANQIQLSQTLPGIEKSFLELTSNLNEQQAELSIIAEDFAQIRESQQKMTTQSHLLNEQVQLVKQEMEQLSIEVGQKINVFSPYLVKKIHRVYTGSLNRLHDLKAAMKNKQEEIKLRVKALSLHSWTNITAIASQTIEWTKGSISSVGEMKSTLTNLGKWGYTLLAKSANLTYWVVLGIMTVLMAQSFIYHYPLISLALGGSIAVIHIKYNLIQPIMRSLGTLIE
ncbi:hypothetical protein [Candidatus Protochlamydia amoebophila]|uniref:Uncharacterized protein n=1 Tax=Protochlamydia amoebophila (strain UWE25) TaxID=264201 RepID=Q6M9W5_PARUW|nr:hypothetical protein [Candidatus Protochlamydia amoebophila]CAF24634.1 unnamed protein product [Candidatus Protochlamydia amoebophila UWE25]